MVGGGPKAPVGNRSARRAPVGNLIIDLESRWYRMGNAGGESEDRHAIREVLSIPLIKDFRLNVSGTFWAKKVPGSAKNCPTKIEKAPFVKILKKKTVFGQFMQCFRDCGHF